MTNDTKSTTSSVQAPAPRDYHDHLADIGSYASILGLFITLGVLWGVARIRRQFLFRARFPAIKRQLLAHRKELFQLLESFPTSIVELEIELKECASNLKSLKNKLGGPERKSVDGLLESIQQLPRPLVLENRIAVEKIALDLVTLDADLKNLSEDSKWIAE